MPSSTPPSADSPDHRSASYDVDLSRTPVHEPPVADPSPHQTRVADPSPHVGLVPESLSQKNPVTGSSAHETPEASGSEDGSEDTFSYDSYSDDELVEKGEKVYKRGYTKLPPVPTTPDQRWLIAPKGLK